MKSIKLLTCSFLVLVIALSAPLISSAHANSQSGYIASYYCSQENAYFLGGDNTTVGWGIDERLHTNGTSFTYKFDSSVSTTYRNLVNSATSLWANTMTISYNANSTGTISTYYDSEDSTIGETVVFAGSNGHITNWNMHLNRARSELNLVTIAHEFGHVIGLVDLYVCKTSVMSSPYTGLYSDVTELDHWGAKVITGVHTSHSWSYRFLKITSSGCMHTTYCTSCSGNGKTTGYCTYGANNRCTVCNHQKPPSIN